MRGFLTLCAALAVMGLGYWAYHQNIQTQEMLREVRHLQRDIGVERERLSILRAEWAYLNRPDRLRELVGLNAERLGLLPMSPEQFARMGEIAYRPDPVITAELLPELASQSSSSTPEDRP